MTFILPRVLIISLIKKFCILPFDSSLKKIAVLKKIIFPFLLIKDFRSLRANIKYIKIITHEEDSYKALKKYYLIQSDIYIWRSIIYNDFEVSLKFNDYSCVNKLSSILSKNRSVLLIGMHYGPTCTGYSLFKLGFHPTILSDSVTNIESLPFNKLLSNEYGFKSSYDGMLKSNHSEKRFIEMILDGNPGMMMIDFVMQQKSRYISCLGFEIPIGEFSFKLALKYSLPVAVIWFSKINGKGYKLNIEEISFKSVEEGVKQYGLILDQIVTEDPCRWWRGIEIAKNIYHKTK